MEEVKSSQQTSTERPEPEQEQDQEPCSKETLKEKEGEALEHHQTQMHAAQNEQDNLAEDEHARLHKMKELQSVAAELREEKHQQRIPRAVSSENLFTELEPVPEIDESASSGPPSPSPPHSRSHSGVNTPKRSSRTPARGGHGHFPPPPIISLSSTPSSAAASPDQMGKSPASRTSDQSGGSKRKGKVLTYEKRREAALKLKQDKRNGSCSSASLRVNNARTPSGNSRRCTRRRWRRSVSVCDEFERSGSTAKLGKVRRDRRRLDRSPMYILAK